MPQGLRKPCLGLAAGRTDCHCGLWGSSVPIPAPSSGEAMRGLAGGG